MLSFAQDDPLILGDIAISRDTALRLDDMGLEDVERVLIQKALARFGGNVSHASKALGLSRSALYRRLQKYNL